MCQFSKFITKTCPCNKQRLFELLQIEDFHLKNFDFFLIFAQTIDCGYTLEPPRRSKYKKNRSTSAYPSFAITLHYMDKFLLMLINNYCNFKHKPKSAKTIQFIVRVFHTHGTKRMLVKILTYKIQLLRQTLGFLQGSPLSPALLDQSYETSNPSESFPLFCMDRQIHMLDRGYL